LPPSTGPPPPGAFIAIFAATAARITGLPASEDEATTVGLEETIDVLEEEPTI
jgi:hypothetical protein